jgi:hypothetical protein
MVTNSLAVVVAGVNGQYDDWLFGPVLPDNLVILVVDSV